MVEIGWINGKSMNKEIYNTVKKMNIGEVSETIKKQESFIILKLVRQEKYKD